MTFIGADWNVSGQLVLSAPYSFVVIDPRAQGEWLWVELHGKLCRARDCGEQAANFLSDYLGFECRLMRFAPESLFRRQISKQWRLRETDRVSGFADGYPVLAMWEDGLTELNRRLEERELEPITISHFRPNIYIKRTEGDFNPFVEDEWFQKKLQIGNVTFFVAKPCDRCAITTINPMTGCKLPHGEPLRTLVGYRCIRPEDNKPYFGQNLIPLNKGVIRIGDEVTLIEQTKPLWRRRW
jgi:uncharacterized protein YcbX